MASDYSGLFETAGKQYNVDPKLLHAVMTVESAGNPQAVSSQGAQGLMQLMPETAKSLGVSDSTDPNQAIPAAAKLMAENLDRYGNPTDAIMAYHGGTDKANWGPKTHAYIQKVSQAYNQSEPAMQPSTDAFDAAFGGSAPKAPPTNDAFSAAFSAPEKQSSSEGSTLGSSPAIPGAMRGLVEAASIFSTPVNTFLNKFGSPEIKAALAKNAADKSTWEAKLDQQNAGDPLYYNAGRLVGNAAVSIPTMGGEGAVATKVGEGAISALENGGAIAQKIAPYVEKGVNFLAGKAGYASEGEALPGVGNALTRVGSNATAGAVQGAAANAQIDNGQPLADRIKEGALFGLALRGGGSGAFEGGRALKGGVAPFTNSGQDSIVRNYLTNQASGGNLTPDLTEYVPGSSPTLAEAMGNPGISVAQRNVSTLPSQVNKFMDVRAQNNAARMDHLDSIRGTPGDIDLAVSQRDAVTSPLREQAFAQAKPTDATPVLQEVNSLLDGPEGKRPQVASVLQHVKESLFDPDGNLETDPARLYGVRKGITDLLTPAAQRESAANQASAAFLSNIKNSLDDVIEKGAPGYQAYLDKFAELSKPIDAMSTLQKTNFTNAMDNEVLASSVGRAKKSIAKSQMASGVNDSKSLSDRDMAVLNDLHNDLSRQGNIMMGKAAGSDTVQNLASHASLAQSGIPTVLASAAAGHPLTGAALMAANKYLYGRANEQILDRLGNALSDAHLGSTYLTPAIPTQMNNALTRAGRVGRAVSRNAVPALVGSGNRLRAAE